MVISVLAGESQLSHVVHALPRVQVAGAQPRVLLRRSLPSGLQ